MLRLFFGIVWYGVLVLYDLNDAEIAMMRTFCKQVEDSLISACFIHLIVDHH